MAKKDEIVEQKPLEERIFDRPFHEELSESYINYSMSVIVGRAIPDVRDGLKPVQRRILYAMRELKNWYSSPHKKSARIVGEVMGKYHPHGDAAIYDALVRMAQDFNLRIPLIDPQGNFGSIDRDPAAAPRYTEARLAKISEEMLEDLDKNTVDFRPNFDETLMEPEVLPSGVPNLLLNGASGIAVGMATNIPPHNLGELVNGICALIDNPEIEIKELHKHIKGPDFPTGGKIMGKDILKQVYEEGTGSIPMEGVYEVDEDRIIITEIPYGVCKASMIKQIAEYFKKQEKKMIRDIRDESDRNGMRVVIEIARGTNTKVVLNHILKHSYLRTSFPTKLLVIDERKKPKVMNLKQLLTSYVNHRREVLTRKAEFELDAASKRAHIVEGLITAIRSIDTTIDIIRHSNDQPDAINNLMETLEISEEQSKAILDLRFGRLTSMEINKLTDELKQLNKTIKELKELLADKSRIDEKIKELLLQVKEKHDTPRRTQIALSEADDVNIEDLIEDDDIVITLTSRGYTLVTDLDSYRKQNRGGRGARGIRTREEDFARHIMVTSRLSSTMFITSLGKAYVIKNYEIENASKGTKGKHIMSYINLGEGEVVKSVLQIGREFSDKYDIIFLTKNGKIKRTSLSNFSNAGLSGIIGIKLEDDDYVVDCVLMNVENTDKNLFIGTLRGMSIRIPLEDVRQMGRNTQGVKAISLKKDDKLVSLSCIDPENKNASILTITRKGHGKRTFIANYRLQARGGKGIKNMAWAPSLGEVVAVMAVEDTDEVIIVTKLGYTIRFSASDIRVMGRATRGVRVVDLGEDDEVSSVERIIVEEE
jgi:DNA gyrase subunit A